MTASRPILLRSPADDAADAVPLFEPLASLVMLVIAVGLVLGRDDIADTMTS
jgi:hypothetical protein